MENIMAQPATPPRNTPRDVFMYLLVLVVLTMSAVSLGALLFDFVNVYLPDAARPSMCAYDGCAGAVNGEIAVLLVAFPVLVWAWRFLQGDIRRDPGKADLRIRRWLLYLALFVSGIATIIDLISLLSSWLNGELTLQVALKVLAVLFIAASIFYYFLRELHPKAPGKQKFVAWAAIVVVALSLAAGIYTSAPWNARDRAIDQERVNALQSIQSEIVNFWQLKQRLPATLAELNDPLRFTVPVDPETKTAFTYSVKGRTSFELCAVFATETLGGISPETRPVLYPDAGDIYGSNWSHGVGATCFERTIDPQLYPKIP
jgi:hypothetical protein